jgi:hypothetical protein
VVARGIDRALRGAVEACVVDHRVQLPEATDLCGEFDDLVGFAEVADDGLGGRGKVTCAFGVAGVDDHVVAAVDQFERCRESESGRRSSHEDTSHSDVLQVGVAGVGGRSGGFFGGGP